MENRVCVRKITEKKDLDLMTDWMYGWWGKTEGYRYDAVYACMLHSLQETRLPQTYGLFFNDRLIGMCQFTMEDLFVRSEIYPWLANVYIEKDYRGSGLGRFLLNSVKESAAAAGLEELYLFTVHNGFYEKFGWTFVQEIDTFLEPRIQRLYRLETSETSNASETLSRQM